MQVHSQLTLVCRAGQSQLILVENGADCRSERFRLQVVTATAQAAHAQAPNESTPASTAASFASQFYGVDASVVDVTITKQDLYTATATTKAPGQAACSLELAVVPDGANTNWALGSWACDKQPAS